jgi:hypothetical protein
MHSIKSIIIAAAMLLSTTAFAQSEQMIITTGSSKGIYNPLGKDIVDICGLQGSVRVIESGGSLDNHEKIWARPPQATAGIFQYDFAVYMRERDQRWQRSMSVVARLHDEYLQIIALNQMIKQGGWNIPGTGYTVGGSSRILQSFNDLKGQTVYAWGGSYYSANVLSDKFGLGLNIVDLSGTAPDGKGGYHKVEKNATPEKVAAMLIAKGEGMAIVAVGGPNLGWVTEASGFGKQWKLLAVSSEDQAKVAGTYGLGKTSYLNLSGGQVQTLTVPALLMTRTYQSPERVRPIAMVQKCIRDKHVSLRDEGDPTWTVIDPKQAFNFESNFPMFQASTPSK